MVFHLGLLFLRLLVFTAVVGEEQTPTIEEKHAPDCHCELFLYFKKVKQSYEWEREQKHSKLTRRPEHEIATPADTGGFAMTIRREILLYRWQLKSA